MTLPHVAPLQQITSTGWNDVVDEVNGLAAGTGDNIVTYGAVQGDATATTTALTAAIAAASADGGTVHIPAGSWPWNGTITVPEGVSLWGEGFRWIADASIPCSRLVANNAGAKIVVEGGGGMFGNLTIDGDSLATGPLLHRPGLAAERIFQAMTVTRTAAGGEGIRIDTAQNDQWIQVQSAYHGTNLILDKGAGGQQFRGCEFGHTSGWHLVITETDGTLSYGSLGPSENLFDHCLFEYSSTVAPYSGGIDVRAGTNNLFRKSVVASYGFGATVALVRVDETSPAGIVAEATFEDCVFFGNATDTGIIADVGEVKLRGDTTFQNLANAWRYTTSTQFDVNGSIDYNGVTNRLHASSTGTWPQVRGYRARPLWLIELEATDTHAIVVTQRGDAQARFYVDTTGAHYWGPGSGAIDTYLYRNGAGILHTPAKFSVGTELEVDGALNHDGTTVGFYGTAPVAKQTGVAVTAAGIHAALVALGLIGA